MWSLKRSAKRRACTGLAGEERRLGLEMGGVVSVASRANNELEDRDIWQAQHEILRTKLDFFRCVAVCLPSLSQIVGISVHMLV